MCLALFCGYIVHRHFKFYNRQKNARDKQFITGKRIVKNFIISPILMYLRYFGEFLAGCRRFLSPFRGVADFAPRLRLLFCCAVAKSRRVVAVRFATCRHACGSARNKCRPLLPLPVCPRLFRGRPSCRKQSSPA